MIKRIPCFFIPLLLLVMTGVQAAEQHGKTGPETFQGDVVQRIKPALHLAPASTNAQRRSAQVTADASFTLPALSTDEISQLQNASQEKAYRVGIGRTLPANLGEWIDLSTWNWSAVSGGRAARFTLTSSGAARLRAQLQTGQWPVGVELHSYSPANPTDVSGPYGEPANLFWTPTVKGDTLALELFLPDGIQPQNVQLAIPQLSHLIVDPAASTLKNTSIYKADTDYSSCQVDIACADASWQETGEAVARYVFTDTDGYSYLCSGTLLTDKDTYTQIPYFLTAAHCVSNAAAAGSMDFFWHYQNTSCGGSGATPVQSSGGAQLLATRAELDSTLVQLNNNPPVGVTLSGWTLTPLSSNQAITGIHHALGGPKRYSTGNFDTRVRIEASSAGFAVIPDSNGDFSAVTWNKGITAPGSSGSGVWVVENGVHYLNGSLLGGSSDCANTDSPDEYSRFERFYPYVSSWVDTPGTPPSLHLLNTNNPPTALREGVIITRYLQGTRGNALLQDVTSISVNTVELENALAALVPVLDIDADGNTDAGTDGMLLIRYLLGLQGAPLLAGLDLTGSGRTSAADIQAYIETLLAQS
ncbi:MAG: hypothetical protein KJ914_12615 [Gammaproteobacteria bacterium]|nr:hypothetical protein [Gammaproteobacteria bacterium]MBU1725979.1 hypothetical protein [Gammaproteobacteria bacterium]MBU2004974.1 hypothetical protein [Gammaproteobacteria bacterium]